jgi:hypothetical protein
VNVDVDRPRHAPSRSVAAAASASRIDLCG